MFIVASIITGGRLATILFDGVCSASGLLPRLEHSPNCTECNGATAIRARFLGLWWARFSHIYILYLLLREGLLWGEVLRRGPSGYIGRFRRWGLENKR